MDQLSDVAITYAGFFDSKVVRGREDGFITKERSIIDYEIEVYHEDQGEVIIDDIAYKIVPNRVSVGKPGHKRCAKLNFRTYYVHLSITECKLKQYLDSFPAFFEIQNINLYIDIIMKLCELYKKEFDGKELCIGKILYELIYLLYKDANHTKMKSTAANMHLLEKSRTFIRENYSLPIQLNDISASVNLSPVYFHKLYKECYRETPTSYLQEVRLSHAKKLLCSTDYSSEKIAELCGFSSQSYFNYFFKQKVNMTPLQFRKKVFQEYEI
jgi:AraC-like DNA-binding protein